MPITDLALRKMKAPDTAKRIPFGRGLSVLVRPNGSKIWQFRYRHGGKQKTLPLGLFPEVSIREAEDARDKARRLLRDNTDPLEEKRLSKIQAVVKAENTFEAIGRQWFATSQNKWVTSHAQKIISRLERDVFPYLGKQPIADITPADVLSALGKIRDRGDASLGHKSRGLHETARRAFGNVGMIFRYAVARNFVPSDPTRDLKGEFPKPKAQHFASITEPEEIAQLLRAIDGYRGSMIVQAALRLSPLVFVRPGELRQARWKDMNLDAAEWRYFVTKTKTYHVVPLCRQAIEIIQGIQPLTGNSEYVFPAARNFSRPMSNNAILAAIRAIGYGQEKMTGHGFRAMARTRLHETLKMKPEVIEKQLAHDVPDINGTAYNRTQFLDDRRKMMQEWADYLDELKNGNIRAVNVA